MTDFNRHPDSYHHWELQIDGDIAHLRMNVDPDHPFKEGYELVLNSYDLGVDMELADSIQRLRFEHPSVRSLIVGSGQERAFCAGANIPMLASSTHPFKVNFCKFTNEPIYKVHDISEPTIFSAWC